MTILALIPARGGSVRLPRKNIRQLGDRPLIAYTIDVARRAACFSRVIVSTEDEEIAGIARQYGADVPWLRPPELATATSPTIDVIVNVLDKLSPGDRPDSIMLLQPTSPFRTVQSIHDAIALHERENASTVVSVSSGIAAPDVARELGSDGALRMLTSAETRAAAPDRICHINGLIYLASNATIRSRHSLYSERVFALPTEDAREAVDIDTATDWSLAEEILAENNFGKD